MKALATIMCLCALAMPATAQADSYFHTKNAKADRLEERITSYRVNHGEFILFNAMNLYAGAYAINRGNYDEALWTTQLAGVPYSEWIDALLAPQNQLFNALVRSMRCYGRPWTPRQALDRWKKKKRYRRVLLQPLADTFAVHAAQFKKNRGDFRHKGECTVYSLVIAS